MQFVKRDPNKAYIDSALWVPKTEVNVEGVKNALTFDLLQSKGEAEILELWRETPSHIIVPRAFWEPTQLSCPVVDARFTAFPQVSIRSKIVLDAKRPDRDVQRRSHDAMMAAEGGVLQLACGLGKTIVALQVIASSHVPGLVVVDTTQLVEQWVEEMLQHLDLKPEDIGHLHGGSWDWDKPIAIATYHTLANKTDLFLDGPSRHFGVIVYDEAHHVNAPTFCRGVEVCQGKRFGLTATPNRADGRHVIADMHLGPVLHKDLSQDLHPEIQFIWTDLELDLADPAVAEQVLDTNKELHLSRLAVYYGAWEPHLRLMTGLIQDQMAEGRQVLCVCNSKSEAASLYALLNGDQDTYGKIRPKTPEELGEHSPAIELSTHLRQKFAIKLKEIEKELNSPLIKMERRGLLERTARELRERFRSHRAAEKVQEDFERRQKQYLKKVLEKDINNRIGLMIHAIPVKQRTELLRTRQVILASAKYGREGLNKPILDTLISSIPPTDPSALRQTFGRIQRGHHAKLAPRVILVEHRIGPIMGMCSSIRSQLRNWPEDQGGPYTFTRPGHPSEEKVRRPWTKLNSQN